MLSSGPSSGKMPLWPVSSLSTQFLLSSQAPGTFPAQEYSHEQADGEWTFQQGGRQTGTEDMHHP